MFNSCFVEILDKFTGNQTLFNMLNYSKKQKVITITATTHMSYPADGFIEREHPSLTKYLDNGYQIKDTILAIPQAQNGYTYAITFILEEIPNLG